MSARQNFIAGEWVTATNAKPNINPSNISDTIAEYARADERQTNEAIDVAAGALAAGPTRHRSSVSTRSISSAARSSRANKSLASCSRVKKVRRYLRASAKQRERARFSSSSPARHCAFAAISLLRCAPDLKSR